MISLLLKHKFLCCLAPVIIVAFVCSHFERNPRTLAVNEVPVAFWSWRTRVPSQATLEKAANDAKAKTLFQREGQLDVTDGKIVRIRPAIGFLKTSLETHFVYNATRRFLAEFETLDVGEMSDAISAVYLSDVGQNSDAEVSGLQLDLDVPTRVLPKYSELLASLRQKLPPGSQISITGLPTWSTSSDIKEVLDNVDFWIPQFYGSTIPENVDDKTPISSSANLKGFVTSARYLNKPFYAGLSAYGYAILYDKSGSILELRGDIDPAGAAHNGALEPIDRQNYSGDVSEEMRYVYRAREAVVLDDLIIEKGETLVFDVPSAGSLRTNARTVRENAGDLLKGICIFRLPADDDRSAMTLGEIATAIADKPTTVLTHLSIASNKQNQIELIATNNGTASAVMAPEAVTVDLTISPGSITNPDVVTGFSSIETLCRTVDALLEPCSSKHANVIRLALASWKPGESAITSFSTTDSLPNPISAVVTTHVDDGRITHEHFELRYEPNAN